jgi:hypothetical protein
MRALVLLASLASVSLLAACETPTTPPVKAASAPVPVASFSCHATDPTHRKQPDRIVTIRGDQTASQIRLGLEDGHDELLAPVGNATGHLFADAEYAWRFGKDRAVLTDVENIRTYSCTPVTPAAR